LLSKWDCCHNANNTFLIKIEITACTYMLANIAWE
jgi:hypothetical protein